MGTQSSVHFIQETKSLY